MAVAPWPGAVAVSGGSDSLALMHLLACWARDRKHPAPIVLTVDHALRKDSAKQAQAVQKTARAAGLEAHVLAWKGDKPTANIEAEARDARYRLMANWCRKHRIAALYVGHTQDDLVETFLLRLGRGSGLDGLSAIPAAGRVPGSPDIALQRPLLGMERAALRHWLGSNGIGWHDDPMNTEDRFARVRVRNLIPALQDAGIPGNRIAAAAGHLARARAALEIATDALLDEATEPLPGGGVVLDAETLLTMPREIGLRALARILMDVSGAAYRPRFERLVRLFDALPEFRSGRTLHGCRILPAPRTKALFGPSSVLIIPEAALKPTARSLRNRVGR